MNKYDEEIVEMIIDSLKNYNKTGLIDSDDLVETKATVFNDLTYVNGDVNAEVAQHIDNDFETFLKANHIENVKYEDLPELSNQVW